MNTETNSPSADELLRELARNADFLTEIADAPRDRTELAERLGVSRKTVYRTGRRLSDFGLVERTDDGYALTASGTVYRRLWTELSAVTETLLDHHSLFEPFDADSMPPTHLLRDATVVQRSPYSTAEPTRQVAEVLATADSVTVYLPVLANDVIELLDSEVADEAVTGRVLLDSALSDHLRAGDDHSRPPLGDDVSLWATDELSSWITDDGPDYGVVVTEDCEPAVSLLIFGSSGRLDGYVGLTGPESRYWGQDLTERLLADADHVSPPVPASAD